MKYLIQPLEKHEQQSFLHWFNLQYPMFKDNIFVNLESSKRSLEYASILKKQGMKRGRPDIEILIPNEHYHGLFIEMKRVKHGKVSEDQKKILATLNAHNYKAVVCFGWEEARQVTLDYLPLKS